MPLYTVILDFKGGTYVEQIKARNPKQACMRWATQLDPKTISGLGETGKDRLQNEIADDEPVLLDGLQNVWCLTVIIRGKLALINVVQTAT